MKKNRFITMAAMLAVIGSTPVISHAAQLKVVQICPSEDGYSILEEQGEKCVQQILDQVNEMINNSGNYCPIQLKPSSPYCNESQTSQPMETPCPEESKPEKDPESDPSTSTESPDTDASEPVEVPATETEKPETPPCPIITKPTLPSVPTAPKPTEKPNSETQKPTETPTQETPKPTQKPNPETQNPTEPPKPTETPTQDTPQKEDSELTDTSYAGQITKLVNAERAKEGLPSVELDADLTAAANIRAREIVQNFAHTRPDGRNFSTVLTDNGISYWGCGENIAYGQRSSEEVMTGWMNSSGHRANILNRNYKNIGVGFYQDERGTKYWVQLFTY